MSERRARAPQLDAVRPGAFDDGLHAPEVPLLQVTGHQEEAAVYRVALAAHADMPGSVGFDGLAVAVAGKKVSSRRTS